MKLVFPQVHYRHVKNVFPSGTKCFLSFRQPYLFLNEIPLCAGFINPSTSVFQKNNAIENILNLPQFLNQYYSSFLFASIFANITRVIHFTRFHLQLFFPVHKCDPYYQSFHNFPIFLTI